MSKKRNLILILKIEEKDSQTLRALRKTIKTPQANAKLKVIIMVRSKYFINFCNISRSKQVRHVCSCRLMF